jgi:hypothetical protein
MAEENQAPPVVDTTGEPSSSLETVTEGEKLDTPEPTPTKAETETETAPETENKEESSGPHPLATPWTLFFSNTGITKEPAHSRKSSTAAAPNPNDSTAALYSHGLTPLFTSKTLEELFGAWKALRRGVAMMTGNGAKVEKEGEKIEPGDEGLGLRVMVADSNFHFFKEGVRPMWEDKMCAKGGRLTISCNRAVVRRLLR